MTDYAEFTEKLLYRHAMNLRFSKKETDLALSIINYARKKGLTSSRDPAVIVGTALYISYYSTHKYEPNTLSIIAEKCHTSTATIQNLKRQWHEILDVLNLRHNVLGCTKIKYI